MGSTRATVSESPNKGMKSAKPEPVTKGKIERAVYLGGDEGCKREELGKGGEKEYEVKQVICLELFGGTC